MTTPTSIKLDDELKERVQALAQAVADGQPVIAAQCDEAARAGLEQLQQLA